MGMQLHGWSSTPVWILHCKHGSMCTLYSEEVLAQVLGLTRGTSAAPAAGERPLSAGIKIIWAPERPIKHTGNKL